MALVESEYMTQVVHKHGLPLEQPAEAWEGANMALSNDIHKCNSKPQCEASLASHIWSSCPPFELLTLHANS